MAGSSTISVNQTPQYGDKTALDSVQKAMTTTPMTGNPTPAPGPGRPSTGLQTPPTTSQQAPPPEAEVMPGEHQTIMDQVAQAYRTKVFWDNVLKNYPSEWSRMYASDATQTYNSLAGQLRNGTPFFE
jgi:hypothetical protein